LMGACVARRASIDQQCGGSPATQCEGCAEAAWTASHDNDVVCIHGLIVRQPTRADPERRRTKSANCRVCAVRSLAWRPCYSARMPIRVASVVGLLAIGGCQSNAAPATDAGTPDDASTALAASTARDAGRPPPVGQGIPDAGLPLVRGQVTTPVASAHPDVLRIVDWNIKAGRGSSITTIATRLAALEPDVVVLQEVDSNTRRGGGVDQPAFLGQMLQLDYVFAPTIPWSGGTYGIATLSRYPLMTAARIPLTNMFAGERRTALDTALCIDDVCLRVINHHADVQLAASQLSTQEIVQHIQAELGSKVALFADLNQVPTDIGPAACVAAGLSDLGDAFGNAITEGGRRIDYAFVDKALRPCVKQMTVNPEVDSDHNSLVVDLDVACLKAQAHGGEAAR